MSDVYEVPLTELTDAEKVERLMRQFNTAIAEIGRLRAALEKIANRHSQNKFPTDYERIAREALGRAS